MDDHLTMDLVCVDPTVGARILKLTLPESLDDAAEHQLLSAHAGVCAACSLTLDFHERIGDGISDGSLFADQAKILKPSNNWRWANGLAISALAASLVFLLLLPPRPMGPSVVIRGDLDIGFQKPVEGEVVNEANVEVTWKAIPGADNYQLLLTRVSDGFTWQGSTNETRLVLPSDEILRENESYRILLSTVPHDLLPPGATSVSFRTGNFLSILSHRLKQAQPVVYWLGLVALTLAAASMLANFISRRRPGRRGENISLK